jgi:protein tyrosine/serine phosphatase
MKKRIPTVRLAVILLIVAAVIILVRHFHIRDFCIVKPGVLYTSDQPRGMDYTRLLYKYHIATIVNVRSPSEHRERNWHNEEITWTRRNGVSYIEMPIEKGHFPDKQTQEQFLAIMADKDNLPVLLHGSGNDKRVAVLTAAWLIKTQDYTINQTLQTIEKICDDRPLNETDRNFVHQLAE